MLALKHRRNAKKAAALAWRAARAMLAFATRVRVYDLWLAMARAKLKTAARERLANV